MKEKIGELGKQGETSKIGRCRKGKIKGSSAIDAQQSHRNWGWAWLGALRSFTVKTSEAPMPRNMPLHTNFIPPCPFPFPCQSHINLDRVNTEFEKKKCLFLQGDQLLAYKQLFFSILKKCTSAYKYFLLYLKSCRQLLPSFAEREILARQADTLYIINVRSELAVPDIKQNTHEHTHAHTHTESKQII